MNFDIDAIKHNYQTQKSPYRELGKYIFSVCTFGLGALWFWATTRVIKEGEIGLREDARGNMILLPPGRHSNFPWESYPAPVQSLADKYIKLGPYKIVTVESGYVAKTLNRGVLETLAEGQHLITDAAHTFEGYIPVKQETKRLEKVTAYTKDNVGITIHADVRYQIDKPNEAVLKVDDIERSIREISEIQLSQVIGHHNLCELIPAASGLTHIEQEKTQPLELQDPEEQGLTGVVHELMKMIGATLADLGIRLINIGIKSWTINDSSLAHELGQSAVVQSQTAAKMLTAERDAEILKIQTTAQAEAERLRAEGIQKASELISSDPLAMKMVEWQAQRDIVAAAKQSHLFYGSTGQANFFQLPVDGEKLNPEETVAADKVVATI